MNKNNNAVKAASVESILTRLNKAYKRVIATTGKPSVDVAKLVKASELLNKAFADLRAIENDVKFDYYKGEYFAKYDQNGNEVFVTYIKRTSVCRATVTAPSAEAAKVLSLASDKSERIDDLDDVDVIAL